MQLLKLLLKRSTKASFFIKTFPNEVEIDIIMKRNEKK